MPGNFPFIGGSYRSWSVKADAQRSMNLFPEVIESGSGLNVSALYGTPGIAPWTTVGAGPIRGLATAGDPVQGPPQLFCVSGDKLYEVFSGGTSSLRGTVGNDGRPVRMWPNGNQLGLVSAGKFYCDNGAGPVNPMFTDNNGVCSVDAFAGVHWISGGKFDPSMVGNVITINGAPYTVSSYSDETWITVFAPPAIGTYSWSYGQAVTAVSGAFLDGYYVVARPNSKTINISALFDGTAWNSLDLAVKEGYPDNVVAVWAINEELWLFGTNSLEIWVNTGNANFPLERISGGFLQTGTVNSASPTRLGNTIAWIGFDDRGGLVAWVAQGHLPQRVSTHPIENAWRKYSTLLDNVSWTYGENGHVFWVIDFPTADATWVYDLTTQLWHERGYWDGAAWRMQKQWCHTYQFGKQLVGSATSNVIYAQSLETYQDAGTNIRRQRTCPHVSDENRRTRYHRFQLDMEVGQGSSPTMTLDWSDDGGETFGTAHTTTAGALGNYNARVLWNRLGSGRDRVFRVTHEDNSKCALINAYLRASACAH